MGVIMGCDLRQAARFAVTFDPEGLTVAQREGNACVVCHKKWPRPRFRVGRLPDNAPVRACDDCVDTLAPSAPVSTLSRRAKAAIS